MRWALLLSAPFYSEGPFNTELKWFLSDHSASEWQCWDRSSPLRKSKNRGFTSHGEILNFQQFTLHFCKDYELLFFEIDYKSKKKSLSSTLCSYRDTAHMHLE